MKKTFYTISAGLLAGSMLSTAAVAKSINYTAYEELFQEPVTVGATGVPQRASDVPLNMEIITSEDIERSAARDIPEVLRKVSGVSVWRNGQGSSEVALRGFQQALSERLLVLLNGRQVYQDQFGYTRWDAIPVSLNEIKQIEVVKGPNTALYGFNATSGVINIITYNPLHDDVDNVKVNAGTQGYAEGEYVSTHKLGEYGAVRFSGSAMTADEFDGPYVTPAGATLQDDDMHRYFFKADSIFNLTDSTELGIEVSHTDFGAQIFNFFNAMSEEQYMVNGYKATLSSETDYGLFAAKLYHNNTDIDYDYPSGGLPTLTPFVSRNRITVAELSHVFKLGSDHTFRVLGEYRTNQNNTLPAGLGTVEYDVYSAGGLWDWKISDKLSMSHALRYSSLGLERSGNSVAYSNSQFDTSIDELSVNSGLVYKITDVDTFRLMYSRGIDIPSLVEFGLESPLAPGVNLLGDPTAEPSVVNHYEANYEHNFVEYDTKAKIAVFYQDANDLQSVYDTQTAIAQGQIPVLFGNYLSSEVYGGEIDLKGNLHDNWSWGLNYSLALIDDDVADPSIVTQYEDRNSTHIANAMLGYANGPWTGDLLLNYASQYDQVRGGTLNSYGDVFTLNSKVSYDVNEDIRLSLTGISMLDDNADQGPGLEAERQIFATVSYSF